MALLLALSVILAGCGKESPSSAPALLPDESLTTQENSTQGLTEELTEEPIQDLSERTFPASPEYVKLTGRTGENNGIRWLIHSASKAEFKFKGTKASIVIRSDASINEDITSHARFAVYVNGVRTLDHIVTKMEETLEIFSSENTEDVRISIVKLSEASSSVFGIKSISVTASGDIEPLAEKKTKIEFIGDSITCGYGIDDLNTEHRFSTSSEDATKTYAYKTAAAFDADYSILAYSGYGIVSGHSDGVKRRTSMLVPDTYELLGKNHGSADSVINLSVKWDFRSFVPDYIVINLGTNDESYTKSDPGRRNEFAEAYVDFLKMIRKNNPGAHIIATLGIMGAGLYSCIEEAVKSYSSETGDSNISTLRFWTQDGSTGFAAAWHPTEATNEIAAKALIEHIQALR